MMLSIGKRMMTMTSSSCPGGMSRHRASVSQLACSNGYIFGSDSISQPIRSPHSQSFTISRTTTLVPRSTDFTGVRRMSTSTANSASKVFGDSATNRKVIRDLFMSFATTPLGNDVKQQQPHLKIENLHDLLKCIGEHPSEQRLRDLLHEVDTDNSGTIEFNEFLLGCDKVLAHDYGSSTSDSNSIRDMDKLLRTFRTLDRDGNGVLTMDELEGVLSTSGGNLTSDDARLIMKLADVNSDAEINFTEFVKLVDDPSLSHLSWRLRSAFRAILVIGGPGSGKGVLCDRLVQEAGIVHCSSGDMLREEVKSGTPLGTEISNIMEQGLLLPSSTVMALIKKRLTKLPGEFLALDGFPRSEENYKDFDEICGAPEFAIYIDVPDEVMMERIIKRGLANSGRVDDNEETAKKRIETFHALGEPTLDYLKKSNIPIHVLDGTKTPKDIWIELMGMNTPLTRRVL